MDWLRLLWRLVWSWLTWQATRLWEWLTGKERE